MPPLISSAPLRGLGRWGRVPTRWRGSHGAKPLLFVRRPHAVEREPGGCSRNRIRRHGQRRRAGRGSIHAYAPSRAGTPFRSTGCLDAHGLLRQAVNNETPAVANTTEQQLERRPVRRPGLRVQRGRPARDRYPRAVGRASRPRPMVVCSPPARTTTRDPQALWREGTQVRPSGRDLGRRSAAPHVSSVLGRERAATGAEQRAGVRKGGDGHQCCLRPQRMELG
jgi:hypothetical protein